MSDLLTEQHQAAHRMREELRRGDAGGGGIDTTSEVYRQWLKDQLKRDIALIEQVLGSSSNRHLHWFWSRQLTEKQDLLLKLEGESR